jgi:coatomer subunit beta'
MSSLIILCRDQGGEKPYLASGADDCTVKIWDYQSKSCVQTLEGHTQNVCAVCFHPELPVILTGSEDGTVRVWHSNTYRLENTLNYGMERVWAMAYQPGSNSIGIAYDEGSIMIKVRACLPVDALVLVVDFIHGGRMRWCS